MQLPALDYDAVFDQFRARFGHLPPMPQGFNDEACVRHWRRCLEAGTADLDPYAHYPEGTTP